MDNEMLAILNGTGAAGEGASNVPKVGDSNSDKLIAALTERLTKQGQGISSSSSSNLQAEIEKAMKGTAKAGALTGERIQSEREREIAFARGEASDTYTTALEGRTGYATQVAGLRKLTETTEKSVRDLDMRYQEALMSNDANTASQIAGLRMQKLEFLERQEQNFYSNLFTLTGLTLQDQSRKDEEERFVKGKMFEVAMFDKQVFREERNSMLALAAEHGVEVTDGDTVESIIKKVTPFVSRKKALELRELETSIERNRAEISAAMAGERQGSAFDELTAKAFATAYVQGQTDIMVGLKTPEQARMVLQEVDKLKKESESAVSEIVKNSSNKEEFMKNLMEDDRVLISSAEADAYATAYADEWATKNKTKRQSENKKKAEEFLDSMRKPFF